MKKTRERCIKNNCRKECMHRSESLDQTHELYLQDYVSLNILISSGH